MVDDLVDARGSPRFGVLERPPVRMDLTRSLLGPRGLPRALLRIITRLRLKQWQHFALLTPDFFVGLALVDAGYLRKTWCHVVDRTTGRHFEHARTGPLLDLRVARQLWNDRCWVRGRGYSIFIHNLLDEGQHLLQIKIDEDPANARPPVQADLVCSHDLAAIQPLDVVLPVGVNRGMYTHKVALPLEGKLQVGEQTCLIRPEHGLAILDIHQALYPRHTWWRWATCAGRDSDGRMLALNLTRNVNLDDVALNENALWLDGRLQHLSPARFEFDRTRVLDPWHLSTAEGEVDLVFTPQGERSEDLNLGLVRSVFHQPYGTFSGVVHWGGETITVDRLFGVCEDHDALW